jgi:hypothetical protein
MGDELLVIGRQLRQNAFLSLDDEAKVIALALHFQR